MTRRRRGGNELVTIYWRDIPAQINASGDGQRARALLSERFQHAIDRAATVANKTETEAYVAEWRRVARVINADPDAAAESERNRIEHDYDPDRLEAMVWTGGVEASSATANPATANPASQDPASQDPASQDPASQDPATGTNGGTP